MPKAIVFLYNTAFLLSIVRHVEMVNGIPCLEISEFPVVTNMNPL